MNLERLMELRHEKHLTQDELSELLGIPKKSYSRIECGISTIQADLLIELAKLYHTSIDYLLNLTDIKDPYPLKEKITN